IALVFCLFLTAIVTAATLMLSYRAFGRWSVDEIVSNTGARRLISWLFMSSVVAVLYRIGIPMPYRSRVLTRALVFGLLNGLLWDAYGFYLNIFASSGAYAAGLGGFAATLITLYLFSLSILIGGSSAPQHLIKAQGLSTNLEKPPNVSGAQRYN